MEDYIIILIILAFAILVGSTLGFGDALIFIPLAGLLLDIRIAVVIMGFWSTFLSILNAVKYRKLIDKKLLKKYLGPGILGVIIGSFLITIAPIRWLELFMGIFVIIYVMAKYIETKKEKKFNIEEEEARERIIKDLSDGLFYTGAFSYGLLSGLIGASGPINVVLLERKGYKRESFIGNFAIISVIISSFKVGVYLGNQLFPIELIWVFLIGLGVILVITKLGHWLTPKISIEKFQLFILVLLLIIGMRLVINSMFFY